MDIDDDDDDFYAPAEDPPIGNDLQDPQTTAQTTVKSEHQDEELEEGEEEDEGEEGSDSVRKFYYPGKSNS